MTCEIFSSVVMRETRSAARASKPRLVSRYGAAGDDGGAGANAEARTAPRPRVAGARSLIIALSLSSSRARPQGRDHRREGGLGPALAVPEQRVVGAAPDGVVVEPRPRVRHAPERDPRELVGVSAHEGEDLGVTSRELALRLVGKPVGVGVLRASRQHV